jgi:uncharacterized membrane protein
MLLADRVSAPPVVAGRHRVVVGVGTVLAAGLYGTVAFLKFVTFHAGTYDLVLFDQAIRAYSRFHAPVSVVDGVHRGFGAHFSILGDHFSPILATLAPLYWIHSGPSTLLVAQSVLFAAAIPPLWVFTRRELGPFVAYCVALAYAISWPVAQAVSFDFHEVAFVPLLTAVLFERFSVYRRDRGRWWHLALPAFLLLLVKEDMGLFVAAFGLTVLILSTRWVTPRRHAARWLGLGFVVGGLVAVVVCTDVLLPAFGSQPRFYWRYGRFGPSLPGAVWDMATHPSTVAQTLVQPEVKVHTVVALLVVAAFACVVSPFVLLLVPQLAERMLSDAPNWWSGNFHYDAFLVVALLCAAVDGVARVRRHSSTWGRLAVVWAVSLVVIAGWNVPDYAFDALGHGSSWSRNAAAGSAVGAVPSGVVVEASNDLGPALSGRTSVVLLDQVPRWAPWVVIDTARLEFPFCDVGQERARVAFLVGHGYRVAYSVGGYVVLHRGGVLPAMDTALAPGCS